MSTTTTSSLPHIFLIGATGRTGRLFITEAISRGYNLTALARDPSKLADLSHENLNVIDGTPTSSLDLRIALNKAFEFNQQHSRDLVIVSTLGQTRASGNPWAKVTSPPLFMSQSMTALLTAIKQLPASSRSQIRKLVVMSMFGTGDSFANLHFAIRPVMRYSNMVQSVEDHNALDEIVKGQNEVNWVMVRPSMLKVGPKQQVVVRNDRGEGEGWSPSSITSDSVVDFMLGCIVSDEWDRKTPVIVN